MQINPEKNALIWSLSDTHHVTFACCSETGPWTFTVVTFCSFATDTSLDSLELSVNAELKKVHTWLCANKLSLNIDKTNFVIFHPSQKKITKSICLRINKKSINQKDSIKCLRIIIGSHLNWKEHIHQLNKKISRGIGIISKLRHYASKMIPSQLYYSLIYPFLTYGLIIWGNTYETTVKPMILLQKKAVRIINFSKYNDHTSPLFKDLNILTFIDIINYLNCIFLFKFHSNMLPSAFSNFFTPISSRHKYKTRLASKTSFFIPSIKTNYGKFNIRFKGASLWNDIDESLKHVSLSQFKRAIKAIKSDIVASY